MMRLTVVFALLAASTVFAQAPAELTERKASGRPEGILLLAHGGRAEWNDRVLALAAVIDPEQPVEVAFGMASRPAIQAAVDRLVTRGVSGIVAVPLFISSHSSVITSTEYLLGLREEMPAALKAFAKMDHRAHGGSAAHDGHDGHGAAPAPARQVEADNTRPVSSPVPIRMTSALNAHPLVGAILIDRARAMSTRPDRETVVIVAHGPTGDEENRRWLADMKTLAGQVDAAADSAAIEYLTVRDDAPAPIRDAAAAELRALVSRHASSGRRVLIVPLLLSFGGIEKGIHARLEGLEYVMADQGLMPDARLIDWVRQSARPRN